MTGVLREILDLPEQVRKRDYVTVLTEAVKSPSVALDNYAVTPDLQGAYTRALDLTAGALRDGRSSAAYIHGSFGTGKSHFMAILSLMLAGDEAPWHVPELHGVLGGHEWVREKRLLRLHFHMVGARSIEEKVFGEYLAFLEREHPDAPVPALFEDAALFATAQELRTTMGDPAFFEQLNAGTSGGGGGGWGKMARTWTAESFDAARASADPKAREKLFSVLVKTLLKAFAKGHSGYVSFDAGLGRVARHAAQLGYDGLVFFLDELILWLASRAADKAWLNIEAQKVSKLVEAQDDRRDIPIVSFVARQRDIAELVGEDLAGAEGVNLRDSLKFWEGRFDKVTLPDRNLPAIIEKKVVRPRDEAARERLQGSFDNAKRRLGKSWPTLLGEDGDESGFRRVYPFTPALVEALVALSHYLQRERTALKVLVELLVEHLEDFELGKVVPIGDLFDVLAGGEEPMDGAMRDRFAAARRLYEDELLSQIRKRHDTNGKERCQRLREEHSLRLGCANCAETRCRADNRLVKTMLLASLVPHVAVLEGLTASRLVQLNHGTVKSVIPGREAKDATDRLRGYAAEVGALRIGEVGDPTVALVIGGPDLRPVLESAGIYDNPGARRGKLRELLFAAMELPSDEPEVAHKVLWRGTDRRGSLYFGNVRVMSDERLQAPDGDDFRVVIDYPFDDVQHGPHEDEARVLRFAEAGGATPTVVWLPSFFGADVQRDLGQLVVIDGVLRETNKHLGHLRAQDQRDARISLESLRSQKRQRLLKAIGAAYGVKQPAPGDIDESRRLDKHLYALVPGIQMHEMPVANVHDALAAAIDHLLEQRFPRHPRFDEKITRGKLDKALERFQTICGSEGRRQATDKADAKVLHAAERLGFLTVTEAAASVRTSALAEIGKVLVQTDAGQRPTVEQVIAAYDKERLMGLTPEVADFVVQCWAAWDQRELQRDGSVLSNVKLGSLPRDAELVRPEMPATTAWTAALDRAAELFGVAVGGRALNPPNLHKLTEALAAKRRVAVAARAGDVADLLLGRRDFFEGEPPRLVTAERAAELLEVLNHSSAVALVEALSRFQPKTSAKALQRHLEDASATVAALGNDLAFNTFASLRGLTDPRAGVLLDELRKVLEADQLAVDLAPVLKRMALQAQTIVAPPPPDEVVIEQGQEHSATPQLSESARKRIEAALDEGGAGVKLVLSWKVTRPS